MKLKEITKALEQIAPLELAEQWDNVGLLAGDPGQSVKNIMLAIDLTAEVLAEAKTSESFDAETLTEVEAYLRDPAAWSAAHA